MSKDKEYTITLENDKTLKQFFDRYYVIPKDLEFTEDQRNFLEKKAYAPIAETTKTGKNGYIVFRPSKKITDIEKLEEIKRDHRPVRQIAKDYGVSIATISKIKNNKY